MQPPPPNQTNVVSASKGTRGIFVTIYPGDIIVDDAGGHTFRHRLRQLVEVYFSNIHVYWREQPESEKKRVIDQLREEFGGGWNTKSVLMEIQISLRSVETTRVMWRDNHMPHGRLPPQKPLGASYERR